MFLLPKFVACLASLQSGPEQEVTSSVLGSIQETLCVCLRHHTGGIGEENLSLITGLIRQGMQHQDRSVRLASGYIVILHFHLLLRSLSCQAISSGACAIV